MHVCTEGLEIVAVKAGPKGPCAISPCANYQRMNSAFATETPANGRRTARKHFVNETLAAGRRIDQPNPTAHPLAPNTSEPLHENGHI